MFKNELIGLMCAEFKNFFGVDNTQITKEKQIKLIFYREPFFRRRVKNK
jgi:hypothetical protein